MCERNVERRTSPLWIVRASDALVYPCSMSSTHILLLDVSMVLSWLSEQCTGHSGGLCNVLDGVLSHKRGTKMERVKTSHELTSDKVMKSSRLEFASEVFISTNTNQAVFI